MVEKWDRILQKLMEIELIMPYPQYDPEVLAA